MANEKLKRTITALLGVLLTTHMAFADPGDNSIRVNETALKQGNLAAKLGSRLDSSSLLNSYLPTNLPDDAIRKSPAKSSIRAIVGGINFSSSDVDRTMVPFATFNAPTLQKLFHDGGEWPGYSGNPSIDDGVGSGESQAKEIYDYDGNRHYPKACLRYIGAHCYIFVPIMFFPTLPKTLSSSEAETPKAYGSWNMSWPHNPRIKFSPDATGGDPVLEPRFILGSDKATAKQTLARIADEFDSNIYPKIRELLGSEPDIDGDPKIFILLDDIRDTTNSNLGYFYAGNQLSRSSHGLSNEKEILFIDIYRYYLNRQEVMGTIAHEFAHMIMFNEAYYINDGHLVGLQKWLEEGITTYVEHRYTNKFSPNLDVFMQNPDTILVEDRESVWGGGNPFANYGASFLWTYYAVEKYGYANIPMFLKGVIRAKVDGGVGNYDAVFRSSNTTMKSVFRDWVVANYLDKCYKNDGGTLLNEGKWGYKVDNDNNTANDIGYAQRLPIKPTETFILSKDMNTRAGTLNSWSSDCISLSGNNGNLNIAFDGNDNGTFACAVVKKGRSVDTTCEFLTLNDKQAGNLVVQNYGTTGTYENILLIPMLLANYNYEKLGYVYSGSFDDLKVGIFPNPIFENTLHIIVRTDNEFAAEPRVQMTYEGEQGYLTVTPINSSTYMTNYKLKTSGEGRIVCTGTNKNGVILSNSLNFSATYYERGSAGSLSASYAAVSIPANAMSSNGTVVLSSSDSTTSYEGITRMSRSVDLTLPVEKTDKELEISIPISSDESFDKSKLGLYRAISSGKKWLGSVTVAEGKAKGKVDVPASLFVAADDIPPVISSSIKAVGDGVYSVDVLERGSGIDANTLKVSCSHGVVSSRLVEEQIVFDVSSIKSASVVFDIEVSDNAGNASRASIRASAGSTSIKQAISYPNPAKKRSKIRVRLSGASVTGGAGSVKIYDASGHKVIDGELVEIPSGIYEFDWDLLNRKGKRVANGTYFADVNVTVAGKSHKERIKITVLH